MGEAFIVRKGGGGVGERTTTPSINFVSKELTFDDATSQIMLNATVTFTNTEDEEVEVYYGLTTPPTESTTTSSNVGLSIPVSTSPMTIFAYAIATNPTSKKIKSEIVSTTISTDQQETFLKRTRTAFNQLQTRVRSGSPGTGYSYSLTSGVSAFSYNRSYACASVCGYYTPCTAASVNWASGLSTGTCCEAWINNQWVCANWNINSFSICNYGAFSEWTNTASCTPTNSCSSNGNRECQTIYSFREQDWSSYSVVNVCNAQTPTAALNAIEIECISQGIT